MAEALDPRPEFTTREDHPIAAPAKAAIDKSILVTGTTVKDHGATGKVTGRPARSRGDRQGHGATGKVTGRPARSRRLGAGLTGDVELPAVAVFGGDDAGIRIKLDAPAILV
jgi:hypothetical protein